MLTRGILPERGESDQETSGGGFQMGGFVVSIKTENAVNCAVRHLLKPENGHCSEAPHIEH
jgi:hypothetical protein